MQGCEPHLTRTQECAILALLSQPTLEAAARQVGIHPRTLWRWINQEGFQYAYRQARHAAVSHAMAHLQQGCSDAVVTLHAVMTNPTVRGSARVGAARAVLELALRVVELEDVEARMQVLEQRLAERAGGPSGVPMG